MRFTVLNSNDNFCHNKRASDSHFHVDFSVEIILHVLHIYTCSTEPRVFIYTHN